MKSTILKSAQSIHDEYYSLVREIDINDKILDIFDSLDFAEFIMKIESELMISIPDRICESFITFKDVSDYLEVEIKSNQTNNFNTLN